MNLLSTWLLYLANPVPANQPAPRRRLPAAALDPLLLQAEMHGVLPIVLANLPGYGAAPIDDGAVREAESRLHASVGFGLMLRHHAKPVLARIAAEGVPAAVVKGPVFADRLYAKRSLRRFTDIDILASPAALDSLADILADAGFTLAAAEPADAPVEWKWLHRERDDVMIEVQTDLVHATSLRQAFSLTYDNLAKGNSGRLDDPASLLMIALVHGACHHFERLIHVVDIVQAAEKLDAPDDRARFAELVDRTGAGFAALAGLDLGWRLFGNRQAGELSQSFRGRRWAARRLIDGSVITSTMNRDRLLHGWRRSLFRVLLKQPAPRSQWQTDGSPGPR